MVKLLLALMLVPSLALAEPFDFRASIDETVEALSLPQPEPEPEPESFLWRLLGFASYVAAGNIAASQFYRQERVSDWEPTIENVTLRLSAHGAVVESANEASELLRRQGQERQAWMVRVGYLAGAIYVAQSNYARGLRGE